MNDLSIIITALKTQEKLFQKPFPEQDAFVNDSSQFIAALCTRRAGKTNALAKKFINTMKKHPNSLSRYIALTRDSAKDIMWSVLQEFGEREGLQANFNESNLTMTLPNNSKLRLMGADMQNFIRRLKGVKSPAVAVDEAQEFGPHLETLIDEVLTPTISDYEHSWLALTGTPGPIPRGFFYELTNNGIGEYSIHRWSLYDNPYLPHAKTFVDQLKLRKKWDDRNPTYLREWCGLWVLDMQSLVIQYKDDAHFESLPPATWQYVMGIDLGFNDADAIAILGYSSTRSETYLIDEAIQPKQGITELVDQIQVLAKKYPITKMVIDEGGLGKKIAEEIRRRHHIPVLPADKSRKMENVALLNDAIRTGTFKAKKDSRFAQDSYQLQIDHDKTTPDKIVVKKGFHSDICLAADTWITTENGFKRIEIIKRDDRVLTRKGYKSVLAALCTARQIDTLNLEFSNGSNFNCTPNHKIFTNERGFIRAKDLLHSDTFIMDTVCQAEINQNLILQVENGRLADEKQSSLMAASSTDIQTPSAHTLKTITGDIGEIAKYLFIKLSGFFTAKSRQKEIISTTKTAIIKTIGLKTWNALRPSNMWVGICKQNLPIQNIEKNKESIWRTFEGLPLDGIGARLEGNGTANTLKNKVKLVKMEDGPKVDVYNLTIEDAHEYFANGILVKNCDAVLYAFKESHAFTYEKPTLKLVRGAPGWADQEATDMERAAEEYFKEQAELTKGYEEDWGL